MFGIEREIVRRLQSGEPVTLPMLTLFAVPWLIGAGVFCIALFGAAVVLGGS